MQKNKCVSIDGGLIVSHLRRLASDSEFGIGILLGILFSVFLFLGCFHEG